MNQQTSSTEGVMAKRPAGEEGDTHSDQKNIVESHCKDMGNVVDDRRQTEGPIGLHVCQ